MEIVKPQVECLYPKTSQALEALQLMELAGRTCYKSGTVDGPTPETAATFLKNRIMKAGHESVIEHATASFRIICDRGVTHEIVRHRLASYSQESTRYVNYGNRGGCRFISPVTGFPQMSEKAEAIWRKAMEEAEKAYMGLLEAGAPPELARSVLPNSTKTELVMTANLREWRHFCKLRCSRRAHPQMREIAKAVLEHLFWRWPVVFGDLWEEYLGEEKGS